MAAVLPAHTEDSTPEGFFSSPFTMEDIEWAKSHLRNCSKSSAPDLEGVTYADIQDIDNVQLCTLINACLESNDAPSVWLRTILAAVKKKDKPAQEPESYRAIGLESCILKLLTLLIHR
jgi:hypothetical protein